jgi:hypothetical protein
MELLNPPQQSNIRKLVGEKHERLAEQLPNLEGEVKARYNFSLGMIAVASDAIWQHLHAIEGYNEEVFEKRKQSEIDLQRQFAALSKELQSALCEKIDPAHARNLIERARLLSLAQEREPQSSLLHISINYYIHIHYARMEEILSTEDKERLERIVVVMYELGASQLLPLGVGAMFTVIAGPVAGGVAAGATEALISLPQILEAFRTKYPESKGLEASQALQSLEKFDLAIANWCIGTRLLRYAIEPSPPANVQEGIAWARKELMQQLANSSASQQEGYR